ncbi:bifunctional nicotinamidase/pyrazinamidase [Flavobacteriaceae bacterium Ap0902]|nr:bifunctional nicotinamidase/pyrazinamidase [Flavobacteriaceae bacterium Ap0902]
MKKALIVIDMQYDFIPGGSLAVEGGDEIIPLINQLIQEYDLVLATQDWHPADHKSFASQHPGMKPYDTIELHGLHQVLWPDHCVQGTHGAEFHQDLDLRKVEAIFRKGMNPEIDSYSGFYDNGHLKTTGLSGYLREKGVTEVHFAGLAADFCVHYSITDALKEGFEVTLIENATKPIFPEQFAQQKEALKDQVNFITYKG